jgi:hypothetical protein
MSKIYLTELDENKTKPFLQVTKPYWCCCETTCHYHMSHHLFWTKPVEKKLLKKSFWFKCSHVTHYITLFSLFSFQFRFPMSAKFKIQIFFLSLYFIQNVISFLLIIFIWWTILLSLIFFSFFFSNYILLYFAEKLIDNKEDEVFSKEDEIPKNQHCSIFIVWNLNHFLSSFFSVYILSFSLHL